MTTMQIWFWEILAAAVLLLALSGLAIKFVRNFCLTVVCDLLGNNNSRALAGFLFAVLLTISAFIGGRGEPIFQERWDKTKESAEKVEASEGAKNLFWQAFTGDGEVVLKLDPPKAAQAKEEKDEPAGPRPSWWNWIAVLVAWPLAFGYFLWAFHDEVARAVSRVWQRRRATLHAEDNPAPAAEGGNAPAAAPAPQAPNNRNSRRGWSFWLDLLNDVLGEIAGEIFGKLMSRGVVR